MASNSSSRCAQRCSSAYSTLLCPNCAANPSRQSLAFWWGPSLVFGLLSNYSTPPNVTISMGSNPYRKAYSAYELYCEWFRRYDVCLRLCEESSTKDFFLASIAVPMQLCSQEYSKFMSILYCLFASMHRLQWACNQTQCWLGAALFAYDDASDSGRTDLVCKTLSAHDNCLSIASYRACGEKAREVMQGLSDAAQNSMLSIARHAELKHQVPAACIAALSSDEFGFEAKETKRLKSICANAASCSSDITTAIIERVLMIASSAIFNVLRASRFW